MLEHRGCPEVDLLHLARVAAQQEQRPREAREQGELLLPPLRRRRRVREHVEVVADELGRRVVPAACLEARPQRVLQLLEPRRGRRPRPSDARPSAGCRPRRQASSRSRPVSSRVSRLVRAASSANASAWAARIVERDLRLRVQLLRGVLPDGLQHHDARRGVDGPVGLAGEALGEQGREAVEGVEVARGGPGMGDHLLDEVRRRAGEHRQHLEQPLLPGVEELVAPFDRGPHRLLAERQVAGAAAEHRQPALEPPEERLRREQVEAGRRQLDRQREAVEAPADLRHGGGVVVGEVEGRVDGARPGDEQLDRLEPAELGGARRDRAWPEAGPSAGPSGGARRGRGAPRGWSRGARGPGTARGARRGSRRRPSPARSCRARGARARSAAAS